jgi:hypothetical protein
MEYSLVRHVRHDLRRQTMHLLPNRELVTLLQCLDLIQGLRLYDPSALVGTTISDRESTRYGGLTSSALCWSSSVGFDLPGPLVRLVGGAGPSFLTSGCGSMGEWGAAAEDLLASPPA